MVDYFAGRRWRLWRPGRGSGAAVEVSTMLACSMHAPDFILRRAERSPRAMQISLQPRIFLEMNTLGTEVEPHTIK